MLKPLLSFVPAVLLICILFSKPVQASQAEFDAGYSLGYPVGVLAGPGNASAPSYMSGDEADGFDDGAADGGLGLASNASGDFAQDIITGDAHIGPTTGIASPSTTSPLSEPVADYSSIVPATASYVGSILSSNAPEIILIATAFSGFIWLLNNVRKRAAGR